MLYIRILNLSKLRIDNILFCYKYILMVTLTIKIEFRYIKDDLWGNQIPPCDASFLKFLTSLVIEENI